MSDVGGFLLEDAVWPYCVKAVEGGAHCSPDLLEACSCGSIAASVAVCGRVPALEKLNASGCLSSLSLSLFSVQLHPTFSTQEIDP